MELFLPSLLVLLIAAAVIFVVLPRFGPVTLAIISLALLVFGVYQHMNTFGAEYRLSTWQTSLSGFTPFIMLGGIFVIVILYFLFLSPFGGKNTAEAAAMPSLNNMPSAESATNAVTEGINKGLQGLAGVVGLGANAKPNNKKNNVNAAPNGTGNAGIAAAANKAANQAVEKVNQTVNAVKNALAGMGVPGLGAPSPAPSANRIGNNLKKPNVAGEPRMVSGLKIPLSEI